MKCKGKDCNYDVMPLKSNGHVVMVETRYIDLEFGMRFDPTKHVAHICRPHVCVICEGERTWDQARINPQAFADCYKLCKKCEAKLLKVELKPTVVYYY